MKNQIKIAAIAGILAFASCSKDAANEESQTANLSSQISVSAKEQTPNAAFDTEKKGIYKGIIAAADTQDRGVIWINADNNGTYSAYAEMVGGDVINYTSENAFVAADYNRQTTFVAPNSSFTLDLSQAKATVTNVTLNNELYFIQVAKATSNRMPFTFTGTFSDPENPFFNGTWNLMTDGTPAGSVSGEAISMLMVTYNGFEFTDTTFEAYDGSACGLSATEVPSMADFIAAEAQTSNLGGATSWGMIVNNTGTYFTSQAGCVQVASGTFSWSDANEAYDGIILID